MSNVSNGSYGTNGPLDFGPSSNVSGISADVGEEISWGMAFLDNSGADPVVLVSASLVPVGEAGGRVEVTAVEALLRSRQTTDELTGIGSVYGPGYDYVPAEARSPIAGTTVKAKDTVEIIFRLRPTSDGAWRFSGVSVTYRSDGVTYTALARSGLRICAPRMEDVSHCEGRATATTGQ